MVQGYKTINIKEEVIYRIRDLEENRNAIEQDRFNLAGFVSRVLLEYMSKERIDKKEDLNLDQIKNALKEALGERKEQGNVPTTDTNAGITIEDLKQALLGLENDIDMKIRDMLNEVMNKL